MFDYKTSKILLLAFGAHPDDVEIGAGGTISKLTNSGNKVVIADITNGELGTNGTVETRKQEAEKSSRILKLKKRVNLGLRDGFFEINEKNLVKVIEIIRHFRPQYIFANPPQDRHPDHGRCSELITRANFLSGLEKIETIYKDEFQTPWRAQKLLYYINHQFLKPDVIIDTSGHLDAKIDAIKAFGTQFVKGKETKETPINQGFVKLLEQRDRDLGSFHGFETAEGFVSPTPIAVSNLSEIK